MKELFNLEIENSERKNIEFDKMLASVLEQSKTFASKILVLNVFDVISDTMGSSRNGSGQFLRVDTLQN